LTSKWDVTRYSKGATLALPVVITGQEVPGMLGLSSMIREKVDCAKPFENVKMDVLPVTYMSIDELESLAIAFNGKLDLRTFIEKKQQHADPIARANTIRNYLYYYCSESRLPEGATPRSLPGSDGYLQRVVIDTVAKWGMHTEDLPPSQ
jgi:hypothetical protein